MEEQLVCAVPCPLEKQTVIRASLVLMISEILIIINVIDINQIKTFCSGLKVESKQAKNLSEDQLLQVCYCLSFSLHYNVLGLVVMCTGVAQKHLDGSWFDTCMLYKNVESDVGSMWY